MFLIMLVVLYSMLGKYGCDEHSERGNLGEKCVHINIGRQEQGRACAFKQG